ncbi:MAG: thermonuclease family protein [Sideroxydans sp.]|nr:thermonuclease family protein [Sideroxydans sp.]
MLAKMPVKFASKLAPTILLCCLALSAQAETFSAKVIMVMDGDTMLVLRGNQKIKVRMANIDAPEKDQAFGQQSRDSLQEMIGKKQVQIDSRAADQYGRIVGTISLDGRNINREQVRRGMAWEYSNFHSDKAYVGLQKEARQLQRGLWSQAGPQAPWVWRKEHPSTQSSAAPKTLSDAACEKKHHCAQMASCEEAQFYLAHCGVKSLDGNRDGIPCESLCAGNNK